ncbi:hypothetical protein XIS1_1210026 [Xenorhabdus innexi]|uniref:Uncharacterized protein n=1 Tax=Xenorhabdus innexi TaxID=290109 RepID=A0A1N6MRZ6_9GAMM|nr:hypothetical protein XIS1_1210026 [Xenorhabdus innexi]
MEILNYFCGITLSVNFTIKIIPNIEESISDEMENDAVEDKPVFPIDSAIAGYAGGEKCVGERRSAPECFL